MKNIFLLFICLISINTFATNVTFSVDVSNEETTDKNIYVTGGFAGWSLDNQMTDENADGIYEITLDISETTEFKYIIGDWETQEDMSSKGCSPNSNRVLNLEGESDLVLTTETFNECSEQTFSLVTFSVDMSAETVGDDGVFMTGLNGSWNHNDIQLSDEDNDGVYEIAIYLENGSSHTYNFINGNWEDGRENCSEGKNRQLKVYNDDIVLSTVTFGSCNDNVEVVFTVDMSNETVGEDGVFMTGLNDSWNHNEIKLYDLNGDNIWETTVLLPKNSSHTYNFINGNWEDPRADCPEGKNRSIDILEEKITQPTVEYGACDQDVITVSTTFQVNMNGEDLVDGKVFIIELNGKWEQADWVEMLDEDNDGVFTAIVDLIEGDQNYRFNNGSDWNDENLSGTTCGNEENNNRTVTIASDGSENPTQVLDVVAFNSCTSSAPTYEVTFSVDLSNETASSPAIIVALTGEDLESETALTQNADDENIWEATLSLSQGSTYDYLFVNNGEQELERSDCNDGYHRALTVNGSEELSTVTYGTCTVPRVLVDVTFQVDMNDEVLVDDKVFIVELNGQWEQENWVEMSDSDEDGIYTAVVAVLEGSQSFRYNNGTDWNDEDLTGKECASGDTRNRVLTVISDGSEDPQQVLDLVAFNSCTSTPLPSVYKDVTFKVDASSLLDISNGLFIAATWNAWSPENFTPLLDSDEDGIWEGTVSLRADRTYEFKYTVGQDWDLVEDMTATDCNKGDTNNRYITLDATEEALSLEVVAFNSCTSSAPTYEVTFSVDLSNETASSPAIIVALTGEDLESETSLTQNADDENIWEATLSLTQGEEYEYLFVNNGEQELERSDCNDGYHRALTVNGSEELSTVTYGTCTVPRVLVDVTFQVDMNDEVLVDDKVFIVELNGQWEQENWVEMSDSDEDGIYTAVVAVLEGSQSFRYNNGTDWNDEDLTGKECASGDTRNRVLTVISDGSEDPQQVLDLVAFNSCTSTPLPSVYKDVTFKVDASSLLDISNGLFIAATWNAWTPDNFTPLLDSDEDGIWEGTVSLRADRTYEFKYTVGQDWDLVEDMTDTDCNKADTNNRYITLDATEEALSLEVVAFNSCTSSAPTYEVTFSVDLSNETASSPAIIVALTGEDLESETALTQNVDDTNVWEVTLSLTQGEEYEYLFVNNEEQELERESCSDGYLRSITVEESTILSTVIYGECTTPPVIVDVTFQVNMNGEDLVDGKVFIIELNGKWEQADWVEMLDEDNDGVFTAIVDLIEGDQNYRFNNGSDWNDENLSGTTCGNEENNNRTVTITSDGSENPTQVLDVVAFNSCTAEIPTYEVTFSVNLEGITPATPGIVGDVVGEGDWGDQIALTQNVDNENIWETVISLTRGQEYEYLFTNGDWEDGRANCLEGKNRSITVSGVEELATVDYGKCDVEPSLVDVTFQVNMNGEDVVDGKVFIVELNGKWEQADWVEMLDEDNDGIFTATVSLLEGNQIFRYNNGSNWNDEDLSEKECGQEGSKNRSLTIISDGSENPTQVLDVVAFNSCDNIVEDKIYKDVTFKVDAASFDDTSAGLYIAASWNNWMPEDFSPMTDEDNDGIWEATINLRAGKDYEFKYTLGNDWNDTEDMQNSGCEKASTNNRYITLDNTSESLALDVVAFNSCSSDQQIWNSILFSVDVPSVEIEGTPQVIGNWDKDRNPTELLNIGNNVYSKLIYLRADRTYTYQFAIDDAVEDFEGDCLDENNFRTILVQDDEELSIAIYNSCEESENKPSEETVMVTFKVNLTKERPSDEKVYLAGSWPSIDWNPELFQEMSDENNDGIWEVTIELLAGVSYEYQFTIGKNWENTEDLSGTGCEIEGTKNRGITVGSEDLILDVVCFNECSTCEINVISIAVSGNNITEKGGTSLMTAIIVPLNASIKDIEWSISNTDIATIDQNGLVTAKGDGTVVVTATSLERGSNVIGTKEITVSGQVITAIDGNMSVISIYPNPTSGSVTISSEDKIETILLYDVKGKLYREVSFEGTFKTKIDLSNLNKGVYFIKLMTSAGASTSRLIVN
ncbi:T9SS type A sorting domain-containing protein [Flammeovirga pectinis]|uniref:T9SS type A sorting domain-containing protein n=1 Tax=Flammeovirga pectinis TaxID=2494373 RepID=A0A3Q9FUT5_9BACT|nr:carbohydrate-binding module family 20 domain-containing protein [Flammeovirga pectinis]AZQ65061.1 T9SS type A sorting domain-containing protein [Flammeovirga pectinis]